MSPLTSPAPSPITTAAQTGTRGSSQRHPDSPIPSGAEMASIGHSGFAGPDWIGPNGLAGVTAGTIVASGPVSETVGVSLSWSGSTVSYRPEFGHREQTFILGVDTDPPPHFEKQPEMVGGLFAVELMSVAGFGVAGGIKVQQV